MERGGAIRVRDASGKEISFNLWGEDPPRAPSGKGRSGAKGGKGKGKTNYVQGSDVFNCAACLKESSGEVSFAQHCQGKAHASRAGCYGFVGQAPNSSGLMPQLSESFLRDNQPTDLKSGPSSAPSSGGGKTKEMAVQKVSMSVKNEAAVRAALHRSSSAGSLAGSGGKPGVGPGGSAAAHQGGSSLKPGSGSAMHKCNSEGRLLAADGGAGSPTWCEVCRMDMGSEKALAQHKQGKKHRQLEKQISKQADGSRFRPSGRQMESPGGNSDLPPGLPPSGRAAGAGQTYTPPHQRGSQPPQGRPFRARDDQVTPPMVEGKPSPPPGPPDAATSAGGSLPPRAPRDEKNGGRGRRQGGSRLSMPKGPPPRLLNLGPMTQQRENLPAAVYRQFIIDTLETGQVLVVEGETGCGKTTQVPQFVLEDAAARGLPCNIIATQPRRISAMGVAERVAAERGESIGGTVGYTIRLESKVSASTHLMFCTTGILLRRLQDDPNLEGVTHVFVDEVHERSIESDFLLMVLRDMLSRNKKLRLCLMSATLDVDLFGRYFGGAPSVSIPGRTFPVATMWLEDALQITRHVIKPNSDWARRNEVDKKAARKAKYSGGPDGICHDYAQGRCTRGAACRFSHGDASNGRPKDSAAEGYSNMDDYKYNAPGMQGSYFTGGLLPGQSRQQADLLPDETLDDEELTEEELRARYARYDKGVATALSKLDHNAINYELIVQILQWVLQCGGPQKAADWARRQHGSKSEAALEVVEPGAADKAWEDDGNDMLSGRKSPDIPDDWDAESEEEEEEPPLPAPAPTPAPSPAQEPSPVPVKPTAPTPPPPQASEGPADAVLVFLPGIKEIQQLQEAVLALPQFASEPQRSWVLPLHSTVPPEEQRLVFQRPPEGIHKVVLTTNIAETAVTIDDVGFVIDTGRMKENRYDPLRRMASLEDVLVSRANAKQRRGRAGRVRPGAGIHLITSHRHNVIAATQQSPEVQRVPLEQLVLRIKALKYPGTAAQVCACLLEPPAPAAVDHAVAELVRLEAMEVDGGEEVLTPLGVHLSALPVDVRIGKLLLLGAIFDVPDECLTIAAALSCRSPFVSPLDKRDEADAARQQFNFTQSDHLATLSAYLEWDTLGRGDRRYNWARANFLGVKTLQMIASLKRQLLEHLSEAGFVRPGLRSRAVEGLGRRDGSDGCRLALAEGTRGGMGGGGPDECWRCGQSGHQARDCDMPPQGGGYSDYDRRIPSGPRGPMDPSRRTEGINSSLLKALLCAALYPQVMNVEYPKPKAGKQPKPESLKFRIREDGQDKPTEVALHPSSINSKCIKFESSYLIYHERVKTTRMYVRDCTPVSPYALMLFGGDLTAEGGKAASGPRARGHSKQVVSDALLVVDGWIRFSVPTSIQTLIMAVRESLDSLLKSKIEQPEIDLGGHEEVISAVVQLLSTQS